MGWGTLCLIGIVVVATLFVVWYFHNQAKADAILKRELEEAEARFNKNKAP